VAVADVTGRLHATAAAPTGSPYAGQAFRYVSLVTRPEGGWQAYVEAARPDGAHDLRTVRLAPADGRPAFPAQPVG